MSQSYRYADMVTMGKLNAGWGICGFTSSLYAMYDLNPAARPKLINAPRPFTVLAEIKTYLEMLYAANATDLLDEIERLTRSFGVVDGFDFSTFTPRSYILYINDSVNTYINKDNDQVKNAIIRDPKFSIALPPQAACDYLQRMWGYTATAGEVDNGGDGLIGVYDKTKDNSGKPYKGLCHYLYRKNQRYYSWGNYYVSLEDADPDFGFCYAVTVNKK